MELEPTVHLTLPLGAHAKPAHIHIEDEEECHTTFDERGNCTEAKELVEILRRRVPWGLWQGVLREMLQRELELAQALNRENEAEVWYSAYMLAAGDREAAFAPWETLREYQRQASV